MIEKMYNSKIVKLLKYLSKNELDQLDDYVRSPIFNKNERVIKLLQILKERYPFDSSDALSKVIITKKLFGKDQKSDALFRHIVAKLTQLILDFIAFLQYQNDHLHKQHTLLLGLHQKRADSFFSKHVGQYRQQQNKSAQDVNDYLYDFLIEKNILSQKQHLNDKKIDSSIGQVTQKLDTFYILTKLLHYCEMLNRSKVFKLEEESTKSLFIEEILIEIETRDLSEMPVINLYYIIAQLLRTNQHEFFLRLKELLEANKVDFSDRTLRQAYTFAMNYCIQQYRKGKTMFLEEVFTLYEKMLNNKILPHGLYFSPAHFSNIVKVACRIGKHQWAKKFIDGYKGLIAPDENDDLVCYSLAVVAFYQQEYDKVLTYLSQIEFFSKDPIYRVNVQCLEIKVALLTDNYVLLESRIYSLHMFLRRGHQLNAEYKQLYLNFVNVIKRWFSVNQAIEDALVVKELYPKIRKALDRIERYIYNEKILIDKEWLLEQVDVLREKVNNNSKMIRKTNDINSQN